MPDRYIVESEGNWTQAIRDTHSNRFVARAFPPALATSAAWMWNQLASNNHVVAVHSPFHVIPTSVPPPTFYTPPTDQ